MATSSLSAAVWALAERLRGVYKQSEYGRVMLPFTVLRRLEGVLADTKEAALAEHEKRRKDFADTSPFLRKVTGLPFHNTSPLDLAKILGEPDRLARNLLRYVQGFPEEVREIFDGFNFEAQVERLDKHDRLHDVIEAFVGFDFHPDRLPDDAMGLVFEELIRRFAEASNETAGEHFTPREVIELMVNLLFDDEQAIYGGAAIRSLYDPAAGTGGMLSIADRFLHEHNPDVRLRMFGQELNEESHATARADMLIRGNPIRDIHQGDTLADDQLPGQTFDYMLSNPPFGVDWKTSQRSVKDEHKQLGHDGRFGPGLPRVSDGSLLFLLHLISKLPRAEDGGGRIAIVLNGSPLFTGGAGSGESEIRRHVFENDLLEAIVALPTDLFYNTGIATYVWVLSNRKAEKRRGKVQLIDASGGWQKMRKSLGNKRREMGPKHIDAATRLFGAFADAEDDAGKPLSRIFDNEAFGYRTITVERPERDGAGEIVTFDRGKNRGKPKPDSSLRDTENVPLGEDVETFFEREVKPHAPDAWIDPEKTKIGYEIPFNRHFYVFEPPRPLEEIDAELAEVTGRIVERIQAMSAGG